MKRKKIDKPLLITVIIMASIGILMIYSASNIWAEYRFHDALKFVKNQTLFFILSLILCMFLAKINPKTLEKQASKYLIICLILLILVLIPGIGSVRNGSRSWFGIGGFGIQPSEFTKIALTIFVSKYLSKNQRELKHIKKGVFPILFILILFFSLILLEPDFGTAMVIILTIMSLLFISGVKLSFFVKLGFLGILGIGILILIAPYRLERIISFLDPWKDPLGSGFQIIQSLYAIGPGGLLGQGFLNSRQKHFYLPEPQTDFIFSIISEEFGFLGVLIICFLFFFLFYRSIKISLTQENLFLKYLSFGLSIGILIQALLNLCVVTSLIPVTGVTLPFFSYGGSSLLVSMISIGILLSISKTN